LAGEGAFRGAVQWVLRAALRRWKYLHHRQPTRLRLRSPWLSATRESRSYRCDGGSECTVATCSSTMGSVPFINWASYEQSWCLENLVDRLLIEDSLTDLMQSRRENSLALGWLSTVETNSTFRIKVGVRHYRSALSLDPTMNRQLQSSWAPSWFQPRSL
jgi:hypothetical protein